jgi:hypothetical protein
MKFIQWDDPDPRVVYDNPNLRWGEPAYLLEPGDPGYIVLRPGDPGYVPPATRGRPRLRRTLSQLNLDNPTPSMDAHFHFTDEQITAVGEELSKARIGALSRGRVVRRAFGFFTDEPTCGGSHLDPDFSPTLENMNVAVRGRLAPDGQALFESLISFQRDAVLGDKVPLVARVYNGSTHGTDTLTLGGAFRLSGPGDFGPEPATSATTLGVFLVRAGGTSTRVTSITQWTDSEIFGAWPMTLSGTGNVTLSVVVKYPRNTSTSTFIYGTNLPVV